MWPPFSQKYDALLGDFVADITTVFDPAIYDMGQLFVEIKAKF